MQLRTRQMLPVATILLATACADGVAPTSPAADALAAKGGPNPPASVNVRATFFLSNDATLGLRGDGLPTYLSGGDSRYEDGVCGVSAFVFSSLGASGDAILDMAAVKARACADLQRKVRIAYQRIGANGAVTPEGGATVPTFLNVRALHRLGADGSALSTIPVGATQPRDLAFSDASVKCGGPGTAAIVFRAVLNDGTVTGASPVQVTRTAPNRYLVETADDVTDTVTGEVTHHDAAYCQGNGQLYHMPLRFEIETHAALVP